MDSTVVTVHDRITSQHHIATLKFGRVQHVKFIA